MALQLKDRVRTACTTIGKAEIEIGSNRAGFQNWDGITDGNTVYYCIVEGNKWEVGYGVKTGTEITRNLLSSSTGSFLSLDGTSDVFETYPAEKAVILNTDDNIQLSSSNITANKFIGDGSALTNIPTSADTYTKAEIDDQQDAQDTKITVNNDDIARQQIEITNNTANITKNDTAINTNITNIATNTGNIASNTTAIGTLSGQVADNSEDIAELQDSIFFSSAYSADYPSSPNRDPEDGNMYLQNFAMFTYSYAEATQIFCSKTDESGNVRQFTAIQAGDSIVLNEVDSPNYGRYELVTVEDVSDSYVVMNVIPKKGQGTVITGVKVAFQAFPKPDSGGGDVTVADGCIYLNNQTITSDYTIPTGKNGMSAGAIKFDGTVTVPTGSAYHVVDSDEDSLWTEPDDVNTQYESDTASETGVIVASGSKQSKITQYATGQSYFKGNDSTVFGNNSNTPVQITQNNVTKLTATADGIDIPQDMTVNGVTVGAGSNLNDLNTILGLDAFQSNTIGQLNTAIGREALRDNTEGSNNVSIGVSALSENIAGSQNTAIGVASLKQNQGTRNTAVGHNSLNKATDARENTAIGWGSMGQTTTASKNTGVGDSALANLTEGSENQAFGNAALTSVTTGSSNTGIGRSAGNQLTTGSNTICIGYNSNPSSPSASNEVTIGNNDVSLTRLQGKVTCLGESSWQTSGSALPNMYINPGTGELIKTTATMYSAEEVDGLINAKDKIIEKLEARLTKLEARNK